MLARESMYVKEKKRKKKHEKSNRKLMNGRVY
jgi:hypothetical protein